jgi:hypothetical protein
MFEVSSDKGRVGPLVWYNQRQYTMYRYEEEGDLYVAVEPDGVREGAGLCIVGGFCIDLHPLSLWAELVYLWERFTGKPSRDEDCWYD